MATSTPPTSQRYLQISFALLNGSAEIGYMTLPIKPEELTRAEPSRLSVVNTLGGAWVDSFGRGLATLTISGNTGWGSGNRPDGVVEFNKLRDMFIHRWHELRQDRIDGGSDPDEVRLIFIDPLNGNYVADVVPANFTLRRSKSQPLLLMYNIVMTVVAENAASPYAWLLEPVEPISDADASIESMDNSIVVLDEAQADMGDIADKSGTLGEKALALTQQTVLPAVNLANDIIKQVRAVKGQLDEVQQAVVNVANELTATAAKMWEAAAEVASLPDYAKAKAMQIKGAFSNLNCVLSNGFTDALNRTKDYSALYGASNCSSTAGGSAPSVTTVAGANPFDAPIIAVPIMVSHEAFDAIQSIKTYDMTAPAIDQSVFYSASDKINAGVVFA